MNDDRPAEDSPPPPVAPAAGATPIFKYEFYALMRNGSVLQSPFHVISAHAIDAPEVKGLREQVYRDLIAKHGIGSIPRPTHYSAVELRELPKDAGVADTSNINVPQNGRTEG